MRYLLFLLLFTSIAQATELNLITDNSYAQDGKESATELKLGLELYDKKYGSLTVGYGYTNNKIDYFGEIAEKQNQGIFIEYQGSVNLKKW